MQRLAVGLPFQRNLRARHARVHIVRKNDEGAVEHCCHVRIAVEVFITARELLQDKDIPRIELESALEILHAFFVAALPALDVAGQLE